MKLRQEEIALLIRHAIDARERAYAPYSGYMVGAALLCDNGDIYPGCNIENASYSPSNCAERTAFFKAVSEGRRHFCAIAITGGPEGCDELQMAYPCGVCRQVMEEFCDPSQFYIITAKSETQYEVFLLGELLPHGFGPENLL
ncbi:MAG: cytidine deaminase [Lachnospiraceae bacterium]|nr:cytidine deaminase [Lachnospiraceae bacterium]